MTGDDEGRIKDKLIRVKQEWAKDGRLLTGRPDVGHVNRLPPGQREVKNWPVLDLGVQPNIKSSTWRLTVDGLVQNPMVWSLEEFMACAVGGCAGCTVKVQTPDGPAMKRVCVDGPVFDARAVFQ